MTSSVLTCPNCACPVPDAAERWNPTSGAEVHGAHLSLLGGFVLFEGGKMVALQPAAQRVIAYAALQNRPLARSVVAGTLWPDTTDGRASANLRSALWRLGAGDGSLLAAHQHTIALSPAVTVDVLGLHARAARLLAASEVAAADLVDTAIFETELLPGWWDEWVIAERERLRILQLAALEQVGERLVEEGQLAMALDVCIRLAAAEPLRESTQRLIMRAHLQQGNRAEVVRHYAAYRDLLWKELRIRPSAQMDALLSAAGCVNPADRVPR